MRKFAPGVRGSRTTATRLAGDSAYRYTTEAYQYHRYFCLLTSLAVKLHVATIKMYFKLTNVSGFSLIMGGRPPPIWGEGAGPYRVRGSIAFFGCIIGHHLLLTYYLRITFSGFFFEKRPF